MNNETQSKFGTKDLAIRLAEKHNYLTIEQCEQAIKIVLKGVAKGLESGKRTELRGFGTFSASVYEPGTKRNPKTGDCVVTGYRGKAHFKSKARGLKRE
ncbi:HU family DNA-binding protein (plasmid) [Vibrio campbellii]|uniref:HU family DNA-binding protein n=1 Tax=Vibrio campbellii TaxID=680 RepID=UPI001F07E9B3|nr:HU family DNA-binding protein [Vibrio campbellii]UMM06832.1 HU family DNA-binding protein [Vibrio campbellii]